MNKRRESSFSWHTGASCPTAGSSITVEGLVKASPGKIEFTRLDAGLPLNYGLFFALHFRFVPVPDELNRYRLTIKNLPEGRYNLSADERETLRQLIHRGKHSSRKVTRARILLLAADGLTDEQIVASLKTAFATVERTRKRFVEEGLGCLNERPRRGQADRPHHYRAG